MTEKYSFYIWQSKGQYFKSNTCIMQFIRIADNQAKECLAKFINAYVRPDSSNQI